MILTFVFAVSESWMDLSQEALQMLWRMDPVWASDLGLHQYDTLLPDYSKNNIRTMLMDLEKMQTRLMRYDTTELDFDQRTDYLLLLSQIDAEIFFYQDERYTEWNPVFYTDQCFTSIYNILICSSIAGKERMSMITRRMDQIPDFFLCAKENLINPPMQLCSLAQVQVNMIRDLIVDLEINYADSLEPLQRTLWDKTRITTIEACVDFKKWLSEHGVPNAEHHMGKQLLDQFLLKKHMLDYGCDSILKIGWEELHEFGFKIDSLKKIQSQISDNKVYEPPVNFNKELVVDIIYQIIDSLRLISDKYDLVTIPSWVGRPIVEEIPGYLEDMIGGFALTSPAPFDTEALSYLYIPRMSDSMTASMKQKIYTDLKSIKMKQTLIHECYPGHYLQLSYYLRNRSPVRRCLKNLLCVEGWATYSEEMMIVTKGYRGFETDLLKLYQGLKYGAGLLIADINMQTGEWDRNKAIDFLLERCAYSKVDSLSIREIMPWFACKPISATSYFLGRTQVLALREKYRRLTADMYTLRVFNDRFLQEGPIPIRLIERSLCRLSEDQ